MTVAALVVRTERATPRHPTYAEAVETHLDAVYRYLRQTVRDHHLAEDLTSTTFERALRAWERYDPRQGPLLPWLVGIARHAALDHFRSESRRREREERASAMTPAAPDDGLPQDLDPRIATALETLSDVEREVVALRVLLDLDGTETAKLLKMSSSACSTHLHRAMTKLRRELG